MRFDKVPSHQVRRMAESMFSELKWREYARNPRLFITECVNIRVLDGTGVQGRSLFKLYDYQDEFLDDIMRFKFLLALKARQLGFTTTAMAYALWLLLFKPGGATVLLMSKGQDDANKNLGMLDQMYRMLPVWVKSRGPQPEGNAKTEKVWRHADGALSRIRSLPPTVTSGAGETADLVILDEFDLYDNAAPSDVWNVIEPTTMAAASNSMWSHAVCIIISTARTPDGIFSRMYWSGKKGEGRFKTRFVPCTENRFLWTDGRFDPAKYEEKAEEKRIQGEPWKIFSEYPRTDEEAFKKSGASRFAELPEFEDMVEPLYRAEVVYDEECTTYSMRVADNGRLRVFEEPRGDRFYTLAVDPAQGVGKDYTVAQIWSYGDEGEPYIAASWWSNTTEQAQAAKETFVMGRLWRGYRKEAMLGWDAAGGQGNLMVHVWRSLGYSELYSYIPKAARKSRPVALFGLQTGGVGGVRNMIINNLAANIPVIGNMYTEFREELGTFIVRNNDRAEAEYGCHDDHVMCAAIGLWILKLKYVPAPVGLVVKEEESSVGTLIDLYKDLERDIKRTRAADARQVSRISANLRRARVKGRRR